MDHNESCTSFLIRDIFSCGDNWTTGGENLLLRPTAEKGTECFVYIILTKNIEKISQTIFLVIFVSQKQY